MKIIVPTLKLLPIFAVIALWEILARADIVTDFLLPSASVVFPRIVENIVSGEMFIAVGYTLYRALMGFIIAAVIGTSIGLAMSISSWARWFFDPIVSVGFPTPKIALLPIFMLWFGLDDGAKIAITAFGCVFVIASNTYSGTAGVDRQLIWSSQMLGASRKSILFDVILPAASPQILTGYQIALPISLIIVLVTEMILGGVGLGADLLTASRYADSSGVFAAIVEIAIAGAIVVNAVKFIRKRILHWHEEEVHSEHH